MAKALEAQGIKVVADISTDPGQVDFSGAVLKAKQSNADALFVYTNEEESARALRELRKQGYDKPIVGETTLTGQKVIELRRRRAPTARSRTSGSPPTRRSRRSRRSTRSSRRNTSTKSDHNGMKGYSAMYIVKAITEKTRQVRSEGVRRGDARREVHGEGLSRRAARRARSTRTATSTARASSPRSSTASSRWSRPCRRLLRNSARTCVQ